MVGMATFTIVTSRSAMNWPASNTASMAQRRRPAPAPDTRRPDSRDSEVVVMSPASAGRGETGESLLMLVLAVPG
jgi:hypothetical protein